MATLVAILATTHHPFFYKTSQLPPEEAPPFAAEWVRKVTAYRETLTRARPDVLVMVGSDHFHQLWLDNMPQFLVGKAPYYDANYYNEEREFGLPRMSWGHEELSAYILREGLDGGFDLAFSNELRVDHSITCPIITVRPQNDLPVVPIYTNIFAPPLPPPERFVKLGRTIRASWSRRGRRTCGSRSSAPVTSRWSWAVRASSARTVPIPSSTAGGRVDRQRRHRRLPVRGDAGQPARAGQRHPRVHGLHADDGRGRRDRKADYVDNLDLFHTMEAYFTWYPNGA